MASLAAPHWEAVVPRTRELLAELGSLADLDPFYLAGGTALALRLGHRVSQDLDFFASLEGLDEAFRRRVIAALEPAHRVTVLQDSPLGLVLDVDGLALGLFTYGYPLLEPSEHVSDVQICGLLDIGLMKLDAIAGRGFRKDFYDVYYVARRIPLARLFAHSQEKYPSARGFGMRVLSALVDFGIADGQDEPVLLMPVAWEEVKTFFMTEARRLGRSWFSQADEDKA
jgi:Nucleotidyl transferase AbiEii toxin, Type IV TA system